VSVSECLVSRVIQLPFQLSRNILEHSPSSSKRKKITQRNRKYAYCQGGRGVDLGNSVEAPVHGRPPPLSNSKHILYPASFTVQSFLRSLLSLSCPTNYPCLMELGKQAAWQRRTLPFCSSRVRISAAPQTILTEECSLLECGAVCIYYKLTFRRNG
jgi:hypothetical protein